MPPAIVPPAKPAFTRGSTPSAPPRVVISPDRRPLEVLAPKRPPPKPRSGPSSLKQLLADLSDDEVSQLEAARAPVPVHSLRADSPARPPDWRWQVALMHAAARRMPTGSFRNVISSDDLRLAMAAVVHDDDAWLDRLGISDDLANAWTLFAGEHPSLRHAFECRVLTGQSATDLHAEFGYTELFQTLYERLFFDVRDRLPFPGVVLNVLIGRPEDTAKSQEAVRRIEKALCFWGGREVANYFLYQRPPGSPPERSDEIAAYLQADAFDTLQRQAAIATRMLNPANPKHAKHLVRSQQFALLTKSKAAAKGPRIDVAAFNRGVPLAVASLPPAARASFEAFLKEGGNRGLDHSPEK